MGNTKTISFEGHVADNVVLNEYWIKEVSHCSYCCLEIDNNGYLGQMGSGKFVIGILHTYSMRGIEVVNVLAEKMESGHIVYYDHDFPEFNVYFVEKGKIIEKKELKL